MVDKSKSLEKLEEKPTNMSNYEDFLNISGISKEELLEQVRRERIEWEDFSYNFKLEIEADLKLLKNKRDKKKDEKLVGDSTLFNTHTALVARSYQSRNQIRLKADKNGAEREVKMLNGALTEDNESPVMKALRYYIYNDKFATGISILAKVGWDGVFKRNIFTVVNPLTWVPSPNGDYFTGNYPYTGFISIKTESELEKMGIDCDELNTTNSGTNSAIEQKKRMQRMQGLMPDDTNEDVYDVYTHFTHIEGRKVWVVTANLDSYLIAAGFCKPNSSIEDKDPESVSFPLAFYYWKPDRDNPFGDRPANYTRDVQLQKAEIANLRLNKMRAELYPMYLYNKDYVSGKDLTFWFNKGIPISTGIDGAQVNLQNIVTPIQKDLRVDTSFQVEASLDRQVEKSTSIGEVVQGTSPTKRETLGTNNLIQGNTDVNLALNEEIHAVGDDQFVRIWFGGYYQNFASGDKKLIYAGSATGKQAIVLKRSDFVIDGNLSISIESNIQSEDRKRREAAAIMQVTPILLPSLSPGSKIKYLRFMAERAGIPVENTDEFILDTPQMMKQWFENEALKENIFVPISPDDNDEEHLVAMGTSIDTEAFAIHQAAHMMAMTKKGVEPVASGQAGIEEAAMSNNMAAQAMSSAGSELIK